MDRTVAAILAGRAIMLFAPGCSLRATPNLDKHFDGIRVTSR